VNLNRFTRILRRSLAAQRHRTHSHRPLLEWAQACLPQHTEKPFSRLHRWLADELDHATEKRGRKINLVGPRGAAKSTIATLCYLLQRACEGDEPYIWLISDTKGQAQTHLENCRHELQQNQRLHELYGASRLARRGQWTEERLQLANGTTIEAYGTGQRLRGRRRGAQRPTLIICDDIQNDSHATSTTQRLNSRTWFNGTLLKAGRANTNIVNVGTALHREAIAMELHQTAGWRSRIFRAIETWPIRMDLWDQWANIYNQPEDPAATEKADAFYLAHQSAMHAGAEILWPEEETLYRLMKMRVEEGETAFEREKQSSPIDPDRCEWPETYFADHVWYSDDKPHILLTAIALDASKGRRDREGDWSAYVIAQLATNGLIYVNAEMVRESAPALVARGVRLYHQWRPNAFGVETINFQELFVNEFQRQFAESGIFHDIVTPLEDQTPKQVRIRRIGPYLAQKRLRFHRRHDDARRLVEQLREFPIADHDDGPDALEMALRMLTMLTSTSAQKTTRMILKS
jgi:predicted phage terminase large subunit-like protein